MLRACMLLLHMVAYILSAPTRLNTPAPHPSHVTTCCPHRLRSMKGVEAILGGFSTFVRAKIDGWAPFTQAWNAAGWVVFLFLSFFLSFFLSSGGLCLALPWDHPPDFVAQRACVWTRAWTLQLPKLACGLPDVPPPMLHAATWAVVLLRVCLGS